VSPGTTPAEGLRHLIHDQRNALTVVAGYLQLLEPRLRDRPEHLGPLILALRACFRAAIGLEAAKSALAPPTPEPGARVDPAPLLRAWCEEVLPPLLGPYVRLETRIAPRLPPCRLAGEVLRPVILAAALEALERMPEGGVLRLAATKRRGVVVVSLQGGPIEEDPAQQDTDLAALATVAGIRLAARPDRDGRRTLDLVLPPSGP
jgi:hypothetical protein